MLKKLLTMIAVGIPLCWGAAVHAQSVDSSSVATNLINDCDQALAAEDDISLIASQLLELQGIQIEPEARFRGLSCLREHFQKRFYFDSAQGRFLPLTDRVEEIREDLLQRGMGGTASWPVILRCEAAIADGNQDDVKAVVGVILSWRGGIPEDMQARAIGCVRQIEQDNFVYSPELGRFATNEEVAARCIAKAIDTLSEHLADIRSGIVAISGIELELRVHAACEQSYDADPVGTLLNPVCVESFRVLGLPGAQAGQGLASEAARVVSAIETLRQELDLLETDMDIEEDQGGQPDPISVLIDDPLGHCTS